LTHQRNDQSEETQADTKPAPSAELSKTPNGTESISGQSATETIANNRSSAQFPVCRILKAWIAGITAQGVFNFVIAFATGLLAIFTWKLVSVTRDLHTATVEATKVAEENVKASKASADAAKENVKAAEASVAAANAQLEFTKTANEQNKQIASDAAKAAAQNVEVGLLALKSDRPYLVVEKATLSGVIKPENRPAQTGGLLANAFQLLTLNEQLNDPLAFFPTAIFTFRNYGKGAAIIEELAALIALVDKPPPEHDFSKSSGQPSDRVINGTTPVSIPSIFFRRTRLCRTSPEEPKP
jgi:hypothetical protein